MCDYCNCRSHPAIASLACDHETLSELLDRLERSAAELDRAGASPVLITLGGLLHRHARQEEDGIFAELIRSDVKRAYVGRFLQDHDWLEELVQLSTGPAPDSVWAAAVGELVKCLTDHIALEESDLFPAAHQVLSPSQWDAVDDVHKRFEAEPAAVLA